MNNNEIQDYSASLTETIFTKLSDREKRKQNARDKISNPNNKEIYEEKEYPTLYRLFKLADYSTEEVRANITYLNKIKKTLIGAGEFRNYYNKIELRRKSLKSNTFTYQDFLNKEVESLK